MECAYCAETIRDEALACKHCSRDLRVVRPVILEIQDLVTELDALQRQLDQAYNRLAMRETPIRYTLQLGALYVLLPTIVLVCAHYLLLFVLNLSPVYLRVASLLIPLPFGLALLYVRKIGFGGAFLAGVIAAMISVTGMSIVTNHIDGVPILPENARVWREIFEYAASIALSFGTGNMIGMFFFQVLPQVMAAGGRPNAAAFRIARLLGQHVGQEQLRRRARIIQDLLRTAGPLAGVLATAGGSIYAGLKGILSP
ncbi:MAG: hypothetical protein A4S14_18850 [Proteobacteria bacterium SG_bin9]|nr:MAG: hypothetical protein A4S14_18850 [Proteobacteria bacterium SG_bin9]